MNMPGASGASETIRTSNTGFLGRFDRHMIKLARGYRLLDVSGPRLIMEHSEDMVLAF